MNTHGPNEDASAHTVARLLSDIDDASLTAGDLRMLAGSCMGYAAELDVEFGSVDAPAEIGII